MIQIYTVYPLAFPPEPSRSDMWVNVVVVCVGLCVYMIKKVSHRWGLMISKTNTVAQVVWDILHQRWIVF